jgi:metallo-beta-lactamase family protein
MRSPARVTGWTVRGCRSWSIAACSREGVRRTRKTAAFPAFDPEEIDFVLLTHAHIDHSGLLPRLAVMGFRGPVYCTRATADLLGVLLLDSAHIQEKGSGMGQPRQAQEARGAEAGPGAAVYRQPGAGIPEAPAAGRLRRRCRSMPRVEACFRDAGHILGSAIIEVWLREGRKKPTKLVFSGDLGQPGRPLMEDPTPIAEADVLLVESTYGNRLHKGMAETIEELVHAVNDTLVRKKGNVVIPAFAVGRTQEILYLLVDLIRQGRIPRNTAIFVDSPMATKATDLTLKHWRLLDAESQELLEWSRENKHAMPFIQLHRNPRGFHGDQQDSPGGDHHLRLGHVRCRTHQASPQAQPAARRVYGDHRRFPGSGFARPAPGGSDEYGAPVPGNRAGARRCLHPGRPVGACRPRCRARLAGQIVKAPKRTFVVHGEGDTAVGFGAAIRERFGWRVEVPENGESFEL